MLRYKEPVVSSVDDLSWKLVSKLTSPSTSCDNIKYFTENTGKELHPCISAEIVLKWYSARKAECPDNTFIKTLFTKVQEMGSLWIKAVKDDYNYRDVVTALALAQPAEERFLYYGYQYHNNIVAQLKQCIQTRDGTPLILPVESIHCSDNMTVCRQTVPPFHYNPAAVPPYGLSNGHWYLVSAFENKHVWYYDFISFITFSQQKIINYLESSPVAYLVFVPLPEQPHSDSV